MKASFVRSVCVLSWILIFCALATEAALKTNYIEDLCHLKEKHTFYFTSEKSIILISKQSLYGERSFECSLTIQPDYGSSIVLSIHRYNLSPQHQLSIEDSDRHKISLLGWAEFPNEKKSIIFDGKITIHYKVNGSFPMSLRGFQFTLTQVRDSPCYTHEFSCKNGKCISKSLLCDGHNHCGDNSNNEKCVPDPKDEDHKIPPRVSPPKSIWIIVVIVLGAILGVVVMVFTIVFVTMKRRQSSLKNASSTNNANGNIGNNLQSVSATVPPSAAAMLNRQHLQQQGVNFNGQTPNPPMSMFNQIRRSLRGLRNPKKNEVSLEQTKPEAYQVPSMYPNLEQLPSAPAIDGIDNTEFKIED